ncbi:MAG: fumarylacetoacetate hydrolase family protein [Armatimonadota bacterium]
MYLRKLRLQDGSTRWAWSEGFDGAGNAGLLAGTLDDWLSDPDPIDWLARNRTDDPVPVDAVPLAPVDSQEIWAAGVTYERSRVARMEESEGGGDFYDKVYSADRPELFLKAVGWRAVGPGDPIGIRSDSRWDVPEPEWTVVANAHGRIVGMTIGNDVSSRSIEGENPLYLPQAKVYDRSCAVGPAIRVLAGSEPPTDLGIRLSIRRDGVEAFSGETSTSRMRREAGELVGWLMRGTTFPVGAFLMTGTGLVPPDGFTLRQGDLVRIEINGLGALINPVA